MTALLLALLLWWAQPPELSVLTYNLHFEKNELEPIISVIRAAGADVVALQETHYEAVPIFAESLADLYPYQTRVAYRETNTLSLLSRYPLLAVERWPDGETQILRAEVDFHATRVIIYNVHPTSPGNTGLDASRRHEDIDLILANAAQDSGPLVLLGDFNMEEWSDDYARVAERYSDAFRALHPDDAGLTYPDYSTDQSRRSARLPAFMPLLLRLDYIFHSAHFTAQAALVWPDSGGSDHRPVYARLHLIPQE